MSDRLLQALMRAHAPVVKEKPPVPQEKPKKENTVPPLSPRSIEGVTPTDSLFDRVRFLETAVDKILGELGIPVRAAQTKFPTIRQCIAAAAEHFGVTVIDILSPTHKAPLVRARHTAMYLAKVLTPNGYPAIGRIFGRDHSTILSACRNIKTFRRADALFDQEVAELTREILGDVQRDTPSSPAAGLLTDHSAAGTSKNDAPTIPPGASSGAVVEALLPKATAPTP